MEPKYPNIEVQLSGEDGNAFSILGRVGDALRKAGIDNDEVEDILDEMMLGDYNHLLRTAMETVTVL